MYYSKAAFVNNLFKNGMIIRKSYFFSGTEFGARYYVKNERGTERWDPFKNELSQHWYKLYHYIQLT